MGPPLLPLLLKCTQSVLSVQASLTEWTVSRVEEERGGVSRERRTARLEVREAMEGKGGLIAAG